MPKNYAGRAPSHVLAGNARRECDGPRSGGTFPIAGIGSPAGALPPTLQFAIPVGRNLRITAGVSRGPSDLRAPRRRPPSPLDLQHREGTNA